MDSDLASEHEFGDEFSDGRSVDDIRTQIWSTLSNLKKPSAFAFGTSSASLPNPGLHIEGHGIIGLPLSPNDAQAIISKAKASPFGKGEETLVDDNVRKSWELDAQQILLKNPQWSKGIETVVSAVSMGLGLAPGGGTVTAELYKLLLYESGAFFKPHKDSEKSPGMFGTLVICLPSPHQGGKLVLTDGEKTHEFETESHSDFDISFAAWYSDITHEVLPVTSGCRLVLTYNLVRKSEFSKEPLSYAAVRGRAEELSRLLELYDTQVGKKEFGLPPFLLHLMRHQYTHASLTQGTLKGQDASQVELLARIGRELEFDIYLASWKLEVTKDDEGYNDYYGGGEGEGDEVWRSETLNNVVNLDGSLVTDFLWNVEGARIDPRPRDEEDADQVEHSGWTGNEGQNVTYWYPDTVVVLVPPSGKIDFLFGVDSDRTKIAPLLRELREIWPSTSSKKAQLERMCDLIVHDYPPHWYRGSSMHSLLFDEATSATLEVGRLDLFDKANTATSGRSALVNASALGEWAARMGVTWMSDRLDRGMRAASTLAMKLEFLKDVEKGFYAKEPPPDDIKTQNLKDWAGRMLFEVTDSSGTLKKADGAALAELSRNMDWGNFESKAKPMLLTTSTTVKTTFINALIANTHNNFDGNLRALAVLIINNIWNNFVFDDDPDIQVKSLDTLTVRNDPKSASNLLHDKDLASLIQNTTLLCPFLTPCEKMMPVMLIAVRKAPERAAAITFISFIHAILQNNVPEFALLDPLVAPSQLHKTLVQSLLIRYIQTNVGPEPKPPKTWSLPRLPCTCKDCKVVNEFLHDQVRTSFDISLGRNRRYHLDKIFGNSTNRMYDVRATQRDKTHIWTITKHRREFEKLEQVWKIKVQNAKNTLRDLTLDRSQWLRLHTYLTPHWNVIMEVRVDELPDLNTITALAVTSGNAGAAASTRTTHKRGVSQVDVTEHGPSKRTRSAGNENADVEIVDLTSL